MCCDGSAELSLSTDTSAIPASSPLMAAIPSGVSTKASSMGHDGLWQFSLHIKQMFFGVVRRPYQGAALHIFEAHAQPYFLVVLELVGRYPFHHRVVRLGGLQVLTEGENVHTGVVQVGHCRSVERRVGTGCVHGLSQY